MRNLIKVSCSQFYFSSALQQHSAPGQTKVSSSSKEDEKEKDSEKRETETEEKFKGRVASSILRRILFSCFIFLLRLLKITFKRDEELNNE